MNDASHDHHRHGHDHGRFGPIKSLVYFVKHLRGAGNRHALELAGVRPGETVLDVGSGPGTAVIEAVKRFEAEHAIGVEPAGVLRSASTLRAALRGAGAATKFIDGTAESLPVPDGCADVVIAINSLHHWEDIDRGLAEVARVLRSGGRFVASDEDFSHGDHPRGDDPHADWPSVDYARVMTGLESLGLTARTDRDTAGGLPVNVVVALRP
jgi:SAM-dependent methyltransferase